MSTSLPATALAGMLEAGIEEVVHLAPEPPSAGEHDVGIGPATVREAPK